MRAPANATRLPIRRGLPPESMTVMWRERMNNAPIPHADTVQGFNIDLRGESWNSGQTTSIAQIWRGKQLIDDMPMWWEPTPAERGEALLLRDQLMDSGLMRSKSAQEGWGEEPLKPGSVRLMWDEVDSTGWRAFVVDQPINKMTPAMRKIVDLTRWYGNNLINTSVPVNWDDPPPGGDPGEPADPPSDPSLRSAPNR